MLRRLQLLMTDNVCGQGRVGEDGEQSSNTGNTKPTDRVHAVPELQGEMGQEEAAPRITEKGGIKRGDARQEGLGVFKGVCGEGGADRPSSSPGITWESPGALESPENRIMESQNHGIMES